MQNLYRILLSLALVSLLSSCVGTGGAPVVGAAIPQFETDDARVGTGGFVGLTLRLSKTHGDTEFTLMSFVVGDVATFGAMVEGDFKGRVDWAIGERDLSFEMDTSQSLADVPIRGSKLLVGQGAGFRGFYWVNAEVPLEWVKAGMDLQLSYTPASTGEAVVLPEVATHYRIDLIEG